MDIPSLFLCAISVAYGAMMGAAIARGSIREERERKSERMSEAAAFEFMRRGADPDPAGEGEERWYRGTVQ